MQAHFREEHGEGEEGHLDGGPQKTRSIMSKVVSGIRVMHRNHKHGSHTGSDSGGEACLINPTLPYPTLPYPTLPYPTLPNPSPPPAMPSQGPSALPMDPCQAHPRRIQG